jgi:hypothetical protein
MSGVPQPMLCSVCYDLRLATILKPPMNTYRRLATLQGSHILKSRHQCTLCAFLFNVLDLSGHILHGGIAHWKDEFIHVNATAKDEEPGCRVELQTGNADLSYPITLIRSLPYSGPPDFQYMLPGASTDSFRPISGRTVGGTVPWPLVRGWVNHCDSRHQHTTASTPRRSGSKRKWASCFRLVDIKDKCVVEADMSVPYAALSYVWGGSKPVKLVQQNTKELMTKGGLDRLAYLPRTFQDAIHVTQQLGVAYLWIDALCIQHDNDADRDHQINGMDQIYQEASITIVSVTPNADCAMPGVRAGTRNGTSLRYRAPGVDLMYARPSLVASIAKSDWESRGWTLQEKFFSKRLLYFTINQVFFWCAHATWAEDAVLEPPDFQICWSSAVNLANTTTLSSRDTDSPSLRTAKLPLPKPDTPSLLDPFLKYQDLLQQYMTRNLTRETDILAAFSGILNSFKIELGASMFGLPEVVFGAALLWYGDPYARQRLGLPSWSWCGWVPEQSRQMSWLVVASTGEEENAWGWSTATDMPRLIEIHDLSIVWQKEPEDHGNPYEYHHLSATHNPKIELKTKADANFIIPLPRPLTSMHSLDTQTSLACHTVPSICSPTTYGSGPSHLLQFECDTFFDEEYIYGDSRIALERNLDNDHRRGRPPPLRLDFLIMSGSRESDTWFKRRQGTFSLPPAPLLRGKNTSASVNVMLVKTDRSEISERIWVLNIVMERRLPKTICRTINLA